MKQALKVLLLAGTMATAAVANAAERLVVLELYTSQGCSSCPPADALMGELVKRKDILPLSLHVDYWDYIGWKDTFASPEHTQRQRGYAVAAGARSVYTPQMVIGGVDHVIGARAMEIAMHISEHLSEAPALMIDVSQDGDAISITATPAAPMPGAYAVFLVGFTPKESVDIRRGENAGHEITYHNIVRDMEVIGVWDGQEAFSLSAPKGDADDYAVLVQREGFGPIIGAARLP